MILQKMITSMQTQQDALKGEASFLFIEIYQNQCRLRM